MKITQIIVVLGIVALGALFFISSRNQNNAMIRVATPTADAFITSPLVISGQARGNWYFEASFPAELIDANGKQLFIGPVQAQGEWMTEEFVPFNSEIIFAQPETANGTLILRKDNPSGLPENDAEVRIPVRFQ